MLQLICQHVNNNHPVVDLLKNNSVIYNSNHASIIIASYNKLLFLYLKIRHCKYYTLNTTPQSPKSWWIRNLMKSAKIWYQQINNHTVQHKILQHNDTQTYFITNLPAISAVSNVRNNEYTTLYVLIRIHY